MGATSPSASGLELTMAVPGLSSSSGSEGFAGCNNGNNNVRVDLDMNQPASGGEEEEFPMGSVEEDEEERGGGGGPHRPKKLRLSKEQSRLLEESFRLNHSLTPKQKEALAVKLKLRPRQVEVWFQNRRARTKLKQTEMECEYLKRCFGSLTEENRRLQREVEELRAMRVAPPTVLSPHTRQPLPASALTMCPRCERITAATGPRPRAPPARRRQRPRSTRVAPPRRFRAARKGRRADATIIVDRMLCKLIKKKLKKALRPCHAMHGLKYVALG